MAKLRLPREKVENVLVERVRLGEDLDAKVNIAERTWGHRDWLDLFESWRADTITELKAGYEGKDIALEFWAATERTERSSPQFTFDNRKTAVRSGIQATREPD
jgi:hypothetical protein